MRLGGGQLRFGLQAAIAPNVIHREAALAEHAAHEQPAMTPGGVLLGTQRRHDVLPQAILQPRHARLETGRFDYLVVQDMAGGIVVSVAARPAAKLTAQVDVLESRRAQSLHERLAIELRSVLGIGARTHIGDDLHGMECQQLQEFLHGMVRVAYGQDPQAALRLLLGGRHDLMIRHRPVGARHRPTVWANMGMMCVGQSRNLVAEASSTIQRMQKALIEMNVQLGNVLSDLSGMSGMRIVGAILEGQRDIAKSLVGNWFIKHGHQYVDKGTAYYEASIANSRFAHSPKKHKSLGFNWLSRRRRESTV